MALSRDSGARSLMGDMLFDVYLVNNKLLSVHRWYGSTSTVLANISSGFFSLRSCLLAVVVLQDVGVLLPELLPYNVAVMGLHPPPAAGHRHLLLLCVWQLHAFGDRFISLDTKNEEYMSSAI